MKKDQNRYFSFSIFIPTLIAVVLMNFLNLNIFSSHIHFESVSVTSAIINTIYWIITALFLTFSIRYHSIRLYEKPMKEFAKATNKVARGDFSVYVEPIHTPDKYDYFDFMINDFNKMVEELGSLETLKIDFFSNVSHEIKTPLATISNYATLLCNENLSNEKKLEYANYIEESSQKLSNLITNLLKLNKLEKQGIVFNKRNYDVCEQLCNCVIGFEYHGHKKT